MSKKEKALHIGLVLTGFSHIFCCVLPLLFGVAGLLAGLGLVIVLPEWIDGLHDVMHGYELYIIILAGVMVAIGWAVHWYSYKNDCHDHGCSHGPCTPRKKTASRLLILGTFLFVLNVIVFLFFHDGFEAFYHHNEPLTHNHEHHHDHHDFEAEHDIDAHGLKRGGNSI